MNVWREDKNKEEKPTLRYNIVSAEDLITEKNGWKLIIRHMRFLKGKGFLCLIIKINRTQHGPQSITGEFHSGENQDTYNLAIKEGREMLDSRIKKLHA